MESSKTRYIGPAEVAGAAIEPYKTPGGEEVIRVIFNNGKDPDETMPKKVFENIVSDLPCDYTTLQHKRYRPLIDEIKKVCLEAGIKFGDLTYVMKTATNDIQDAFERASSFLWTKNDKLWIPGVNYLHDRNLLETEAVLKQIGPDGKPNPENTDSTKA